MIFLGLFAHVFGSRFCGAFSHRLRSALPLAVERQEELSQCDLSQLATRLQCGPNDVCHIDCKFKIQFVQQLKLILIILFNRRRNGGRSLVKLNAWR